MRVEYNKHQLASISSLIGKIGTLKAPRIITAFERAALVLENRVKTNLTGPVLSTRSGRLRSSISTRVREKDGRLAAYIGSGQRTGKPAVYADILETGGIVRPKNCQWLTIPTRQNMTGAKGNIRYRAREVPNGFFARSKAGNLILYRGGNKRPEAMFILKKQVKIPARRYLALSQAQSEQDAFNCLSAGLGALLEEK